MVVVVIRVSLSLLVAVGANDSYGSHPWNGEIWQRAMETYSGSENPVKKSKNGYTAVIVRGADTNADKSETSHPTCLRLYKVDRPVLCSHRPVESPGIEVCTL